MWLTNLAIKRPVAILMLIFVLVVLGLQGYTRMPAEQNPKVDFPVVTVSTAYVGAGPQEIETLITKPIEDAVSSVSGIKNVTSSSVQGTSIVSIEFFLGTDLNSAASDVREKVDGVRGTLPTQASSPAVSKQNISGTPIMYFAMRSTAGRSLRDLRNYADNIVKDRLAQATGVATVLVTGGDTREIHVDLNKSRLDALGLTVSDVSTAIGKQNENVPSGTIIEGNRDYAVRIVDEFKTAQEIADMRLSINGASYRIGDLGTVDDTSMTRESNSSLSERTSKGAAMTPPNEMIQLAIQKTSDGNTVEAAQGVKAQLAALQKQLPKDIVFTITSDGSTTVADNLKDVTVTLALGALLAVFIVFLFLHNFRGTMIVALAIPTSVIATFLVLYSCGFTLNTMTLLGLSLSVGILVDDSIVVLENIYRHLAMGETPAEAALNGRGEIGLAAVTITMVDVVVFVPIAFMGGIVGQFFRSFGITVATATLFSLLMSFTLAPMLASRWYKKGENLEATGGVFGAINNGLEAVNHGYRRALAWALHHRGTVLFIGNMALFSVIFWIATAGAGAKAFGMAMGVSIFLMAGAALITGINVFRNRLAGPPSPGQRRNFVLEPIVAAGIASVFTIALATISGQFGKSLGFRFTPDQDQAQVSITVQLPAGASLDATTRILRTIEDRIKDIKEIKYIESSGGESTAGGSAGGGNSGTNYGSIRLDLTDKLGLLDKMEFWKDSSGLRVPSDQEIAAEVKKRIITIPGATITVAAISGFNGAAAPVQIELDGTNLNELVVDSRKVEATLEKIPGVLTPSVTYRATKPEVQVTLDRQRAADLGYSVDTVGLAVQNAIQGNIDSKFRDYASGNQYNIRVEYALYDRNAVSDVGNVIIGSKNGTPIRVSDVATVIQGNGPTEIDRRNRLRQITVNAYLAPGKVIGNMQQVIDPQLKKLNLGTATYQWQGEINNIGTDGVFLFSALGLAILFVYILMAALFENLLYPFIIMLAIPQALVGGILGLLIANTPLSIVAMIGFIMLMGLVTKNAILLVDYTNTLRSRGYRREDALIEAGPTRLRPILMTTFAQILGSLPVALALGRGSEFRQPVGIVIIGGLSLSAALTLLVIPCTYTVFDDISNFFGRVVSRRRFDSDIVLRDEPTLVGVEDREGR